MLQIYDFWSTDESVSDYDSDDDEEDTKAFVTYLYTKNESGDNVIVKATGFHPRFWIELPATWQPFMTQIFLNGLQDMLPKARRNEFLVNECTVKDLLKFREYQWNKPKKFLCLKFKSEHAMKSTYYKLKEPMNLSIAQLYNHKFSIYEKNIPSVLTMIHELKIKPSGWISLSHNEKYITHHYEDKATTTIDWKSINPAENDRIGSIKIAAFDIEADSSHGDFPLAKKDYYKLALNIYDEYLRYKKNKRNVSPGNISKWIKAAFRLYTHETYSQEIQSSIQTIHLKNPTVTFDTLDDVSHEVFKLLHTETPVNDIKDILNAHFPPVAGDKVIQIGTVLTNYGSQDYTRHIVTLGGCSPIPNAIVESCSTVREVFAQWVAFIEKEQPNIVTGYNIFGFDYKFLWECAEENNCIDILKRIGPMKNQKPTRLIQKELSSSALGDNTMYYFDTPGIVTIDLMKTIQRDHNLSSYKLDDVSTEFIHGKIDSIDGNTLYTKSTFSLKEGQFIVIYRSSIVGNEPLCTKTKITSIVENTSITLDSISIPWENNIYWSVGKDDVTPQDIFEKQKGSDDDRALIAKYCIQDCELCINLLLKLEIISNSIGMSNVCLVPLSYLFMRGQMIKTLSLVAFECHQLGYLIPELPPKKEGTKEYYEGAEVLEPKPAIFLESPISVLDYGSLYPSSMIGTNISHDTLITDKKYLGDSGAKLLNDLGLEFEDVTYDNYSMQLVGQTWKRYVDKKHPVVTCRYIQPKCDKDGKIIDATRGVLPKILMKLLHARKSTRALIKTESDPFKRSVLDGLQLAYKVTANSLYGGVGADVSALFFKEIAASTTAVGRAHLHMAKSYVTQVYPKAEVVYGDTDSIFVNFHVNGDTHSEKLQKSIDMSIEIEKGIQKLLKYPHKLEYEKTFFPFILLRKKGYIGNKYEFDVNSYKRSSMGVVTKRRDNAPIVKYVYDGIIKHIVDDHDIERSISFLNETVQKILQGKFPMSYFIITKRLSAEYKDPERIVHKVLADRIAERTPGNKPQSNDRLPFVYIHTSHKPKLQGERVEHPDYIQEHGLKIDYLFYITNQIQKPVTQIYALALKSLKCKLGDEHFANVEKELMKTHKDPSIVREKVMTQKMTAAYNVLFKKIVDLNEATRYGQKSITSFFKT